MHSIIIFNECINNNKNKKLILNLSEPTIRDLLATFREIQSK